MRFMWKNTPSYKSQSNLQQFEFFNLSKYIFSLHLQPQFVWSKWQYWRSLSVQYHLLCLLAMLLYSLTKWILEYVVNVHFLLFHLFSFLNFAFFTNCTGSLRKDFNKCAFLNLLFKCANITSLVKLLNISANI